MRIEPGALLLIPFPFTDLSAAKRRPVLALTAPDAYGDFVALPVTTRPQGAAGLPLTDADLTSGGLPRTSWVRVEHPVTLSSSLAVRLVATVGPPVLAEAVRRLCTALGRTD